MYVQPPVDYPKAKDAQPNQQGDITYAALLNLAQAEQPITDAMIREACTKMEAAQQYPFAPPTATNDLASPKQTHSARSARLLTLLTKLRSARSNS